MPLEIRSIEQREAQIIADVQSETGQTIPPIQESWDRLWARVNAGMSKIIELAINRGARNILPSKTQSEEVLQVYSGWANTPRGDAVKTILNVVGTGVVGETISGGPSGVSYVSEIGQKYHFEDDYEITESPFNTEVVAYLAGADANLLKGDLAITAQDPNIGGELAVYEPSPLSREGREIELFEAWRANTDQGLKRPQLPDNYSFFNTTARNTPGGEIAAGYAYVQRPGQLRVFVEARGDDRVPTPEQVQSVYDWFDGTTDGVVRIPPRYVGFLPDEPTTPRFAVVAITSTAFSVRVTGMTPNTDVTQGLVGGDISNWFDDRRPYLRGVSVYNLGLIDVKALTSLVQSRIDSGDIQDFTAIEYSLDGATFVPIDKYFLGEGELSETDEGSIVWPV